MSVCPGHIEKELPDTVREKSSVTYGIEDSKNWIK